MSSIRSGVYTTDDIADLLKVSRNTALKLMEQMVHVDVSTTPGKRQLRVMQGDYDAWLRRRKETEAAAPPQRKAKRKAMVGECMDENGMPYVRRNGQLVPRGA